MTPINDKCGLWVKNAAGAAQRVPLEAVRIDAEVTGTCASVSLTQRYSNQEKVPLEAVYTFPLEEGASVCGFQVRVGERLIVGRVEEREKAFEQYDDAMAAGHGAYLLDQERPNIFTASVGNLEPGASVEVTIEYVALLDRYDDAVRLMLPTTVSPRYMAAQPAEVGQPDAERIDPLRQDAVPYGLTLTVDVAMGTAIKAVESPSHKVRVEMDGERANVSLSQADVALDRDFVLTVETREPHQPFAAVAVEDGTRVAMLTLFPDFDELTSGGSELHFVLDCSGSMQGESIEQAKRALALCLRAMNEGDRFNIVRFGSSYQMLWDEPRTYSDETLQQANEYVLATSANLGGTEVYAPMHHLMQQETEGARQVLLLTDGQVNNEAQVIALCKDHSSNTRVFSFGIGAGASEHLVRGVARASRGAAEFIAPGERIEPKVLRMFRRVGTPAVDEISVDWGGLQVDQTPQVTPPVFAGDAFTVFARLNGGSASSVTLRAGNHSWAVPIDVERAAKNGAIPKLWARQRIRDLEDGRSRGGSAQGRGRREERRRQELVELGKRFGLLSSATSFVAIEQRDAASQTTSQAQLRRVPVALTSGWGGDGQRVTGQHPQRSQGYPPPPGMGAPPPLRIGAPPPGFGPPAPPGPPMMPMMAPAAMGPPPMAGMPGPPPPPQNRARAVPPPAPPHAPAPAPPSFGAASSGVFAEYDGEVEGASMTQVGGRRSDALYDILLSQRANGSFRLSPAVLRSLGDRADAVRQAIAQYGEELVTTVAVLQWLDTHMAARQDEWMAAASKARRWLKKQPQQLDPQTLAPA